MHAHAWQGEEASQWKEKLWSTVTEAMSFSLKECPASFAAMCSNMAEQTIIVQAISSQPEAVAP